MSINFFALPSTRNDVTHLPSIMEIKAHTMFFHFIFYYKSNSQLLVYTSVKNTSKLGLCAVRSLFEKDRINGL